MGTVAALHFQPGSLAECDDPGREGSRPVDSDQGLGANFPARRNSEQWMTGLDALNIDIRNLPNHSLDEQRLDPLNPVPVGAKSAIADGQGDSDKVNSEGAGPAAGDDVEEALDRRRLDRFEDCKVDRSDRIGMPSREGDEVLVRLLGLPEPFAKPGNDLFLEMNDLPHRPFHSRNRLISSGPREREGLSSSR